VEFGLRLFSPQRLITHNPGMFLPEPDFGYRLTPRYVGTAQSHEYDHELRINSLGLRDKEYDVIKPDGTYRILLLGDSFVFNYGIPYGLAFDAIIEDLLNKKSRHSDKIKNYEVINAGIGGYDPYYEILFYKKYPKVIFKEETKKFDGTKEVFKLISKEFYRGPQFIIFMIPHRITVNEAYRDEMLSIYNIDPEQIDIDRPKLLFKSITDELDLTSLDLTTHFRNNDPSSLYYEIDGHWNIKGNKITAEILFDWIVKLIQTKTLAEDNSKNNLNYSTLKSATFSN
jgi:hypothetical protein